MGLLSCDGFDYIVYDESLGNRQLVPLRQILPHFRNGEPIPMRQKYETNNLSPSLSSSALTITQTKHLVVTGNFSPSVVRHALPTRPLDP